MRYRRTLQTSIIALALILGFIPAHFNGLSVLAIMLLATTLLFQPGVLAMCRDRAAISFHQLRAEAR